MAPKKRKQYRRNAKKLCGVTMMVDKWNLLVFEESANLRGTGGSRRYGRTSAMGMSFLHITVLFICVVLAIANMGKDVRALTWGSEQEISTDATTENQGFPAVAVEGSKVHVVWTDEGDGDNDTYYRHYNSTGWEPEQEISTDIGTEDQFEPSVAAESGGVHAVWADYEDGDSDIYYRRYNGTDWEPEEEISTDFGIENQGEPSIAIESGKLHVVWKDAGDGDNDIYYRHYNGTGWEPEQEISTDIDTDNQYNPSITVEGNRVHVAWAEVESGADKIYYRCFNGTDWEPEQQISNGIVGPWQWRPSVAAESGKVHIAWTFRVPGNSDILYRHFNGTDWEPTIRVATEDGQEQQWRSSVAARDGKVHVIWVNANVTSDLYYRYFNGTDWEPEMSIREDIGGSWRPDPSIVVGSDRIHIVWVDGRDGDEDIYYMGGMEDVIPPTSSANPIISRYWRSSAIFDIEWTANDDFDLANVTLHYRHSTDNSSWSSWAEWAYDDTVSGGSASGVFSFTAPLGDGFYEFYTNATDSSGNSETAPAISDGSLGLDMTSPTGTILINNGDAWTTSVSVSLMTTYLDNLSGVSEVRYSNDSMWDTESWEPPSANRSWTLTSGDGGKTVYYQIKDSANLTSITYSDVIGLDVTPPTGSIIINDGDDRTTSSSLALSLTYSDSTSGVYQVRFSNDGIWDTEPWESPFGVKVWKPTSGYGMKTVHYQIKDNAGLESVTYTDSIKVAVSSNQFLGLLTAIIVLSTCAISFAALWSRESTKYSLLTFFLPLYSRLSREKVLDHETRGMIRGYVIANPGDHFNAIRAALGLKNGTLAHHLGVLEREDFIKSIKDGKYRRFFPFGARVAEGSHPTKIERLILEILEETPGRTQKEIARRLGVSQPAVSYHVGRLKESNRIRAEKRGMALRYYVTEPPA